MRNWFHYTQSELTEALRRAGIARGDIVFSHIDMRKMGIPKEFHKGKTPVDVILSAMLDAIGPEGTFLTPTYSYSLCRNEIFDPQETPSRVGVFGNEFRKLKGVKRSCEPIFSVAGIGPKVEELFSKLPHTCFGRDCIYERLMHIDAKVCNIGLDLFFITPIHYFEQCIGVPYRFLKLFSGYVRRQGRLIKETWLYNVRVLGDFSLPAAIRLGEDAKKVGLCRVVPIGLGQLSAIRLQDAYQICKIKIKENPWYLAKGPVCDPIQREKERVAEKKYDVDLAENASIEQIVHALWHLPRDIVSDGYTAALQALASQVPMTIHEYLTGTECFNWIIPEKWTCREAYLQTLSGKKLFSYANNPLHVVSYSLPFEGVVSRKELFRHLHVHCELPDALPFVFKYLERDWGLCCSKRLKDSLPDESYHVVIKTDFSYSKLKVGEIVVPGEREKCFVFCAHLCHPHMVNDGLSGVVVAVNVMRNLLKRKGLRYTYRLIILPETIGLAAYLSHNEGLIPKLIGGLFLDVLATKHPHMLRPSLVGNTWLDECISSVIKKHAPDSQIGNFLKDILTDERRFNVPGIYAPLLSLSRAMSQGKIYKEHHCSLDTPENADFQNLNASCALVIKIVEAIEKIDKIDTFGGVHTPPFRAGKDYAAVISTLSLSKD